MCSGGDGLHYNFFRAVFEEDDRNSMLCMWIWILRGLMMNQQQYEETRSYGAADNMCACIVAQSGGVMNLRPCFDSCGWVLPECYACQQPAAGALDIRNLILKQRVHKLICTNYSLDPVTYLELLEHGVVHHASVDRIRNPRALRSSYSRWRLTINNYLQETGSHDATDNVLMHCAEL